MKRQSACEGRTPYFKNINVAKIMSMTANAEKDFIEKMEQQHFKECWQEVIQSIIEKIKLL